MPHGVNMFRCMIYFKYANEGRTRSPVKDAGRAQVTRMKSQVNQVNQVQHRYRQHVLDNEGGVKKKGETRQVD